MGVDWMASVAVSIIIPVYNVENYLTCCLESVIYQTFNNYEIIIVNDGSTDNSLSIIKNYSNKYRNIRVINQKNQGQSVARNRALEIANGEYIYFLDSDDYIEKNTLEMLYAESKQNNLDLLMFDGDDVYESFASDKMKFGSNYIKSGNYPNVVDGKKMFIDLMENKDYTCSPCLLFVKRELLEKKSLRFYEGIIQEDELFTFELILSSTRVKHINKVFFHRRIRQNSTMTGKNFHKSFQGYNIVFYEMLNFRDKISTENSQKLNKAMNKKIGYIYGSALNRYCYVDAVTKKKLKIMIHELKLVGKQNKYFHRKEYLLFAFSHRAYCLLRKLYDLKSYR